MEHVTEVYNPEIWPRGILKQSENASSFRVSFPMEHVTEVYNPEIWPRGVAIRRFYFKKSNFGKATTPQQPE
ncbi:hypothetical protein QE152_g35062 [Popillia japonica]|uniref:Uncharacterized protein n=1 Tax=Popillia japonica TaxID=7064 RepID=A0AAW1IS46_POPJA